MANLPVMGDVGGVTEELAGGGRTNGEAKAPAVRHEDAPRPVANVLSRFKPGPRSETRNRG